MARRLDKTLADYAAIAISPALIMTLVGSLVFFLLEVFYQGHSPARLSFILGAFVFAVVLVARVSIESGLERAALYALALAVVTGLAIQRFVVVHGVPASTGAIVNFSLMGLIWWCAHKLTWDCTVIDETKDVSGEGLLQTVGLDDPASSETTDNAHRPKRRQRPHAPGVWVVYFSLAALPVFGLGQLLVPLGNLERRRYVFFLMLVYVASGMGLLLTTSFLRLRRFLRQRRLQMPTMMANVWLTIGSIMIVLFLAVAMLLPRPAAEYAVSSLTGVVGSPESATDDNAVGNEGQDRGQKNARTGSSGEQNQQRGAADDKRPGERSEQDDSSSSDKRGGQGSPRDQGPTDRQERRPSRGDPGKSGGENGQGSSGSNKGQSSSNSRQGQQNNQQPAGKKPVEQNRSNETSGGGKSPESSQSRQASPEDQPSEGSRQDRRNGDAGSTAQPRSRPPLANISGWLGIALKWLFNAVLFAVVGYLIWRYRHELLAAIKQLAADLKDFWRRLFGGGKRLAAKPQASAEAEAARRRGRPFSDYPDPFANGLAQRATPAQLIVYSFEAMEAWAREHGCGREPEETPREFAAQLADAAPGLGTYSRELASLYSQVAYAPGTMPAVGLDGLQRFWRELQSTTVA